MLCIHCYLWTSLAKTFVPLAQIRPLRSGQFSRQSLNSEKNTSNNDTGSVASSTHVRKQAPSVTHSEDYDWRKDLRVRDQKFVDHVMCHARGGAGGMGLEKFGGVGGGGGDVFLLADSKKK